MTIEHIAEALIEAIAKLEAVTDHGPEFRKLAAAVVAFRSSPEHRALMNGGGNGFLMLLSAIDAAVDMYPILPPQEDWTVLARMVRPSRHYRPHTSCPSTLPVATSIKASRRWKQPSPIPTAAFADAEIEIPRKPEIS